MSEGHPYATDAIVAYHDGEMTDGERESFEAHLATCAQCQKTLAAATVSLGAMDERLEEPPPLQVGEALAALRRGEGQARAARRTRRVVWSVAAGLAVAAAVMAALLLTKQAPPAAPDRRQQFAPAPPPGP